MNVLSILADKGIIKPGDITPLTSEAASEGMSIEGALAKRGVTIEAMLGALSEHYGIPSRILPQGKEIEQAALEFIPQESAEHYKFVPLGIVDGALEVGVTDPDNIGARDALQFISTRAGMPYKLFLISESDFNKVIEEYHNLSGVVGEALTEFEGADAVSDEERKLEQDETTAVSGEEGDENIKASSPVTKIVQTALKYAVEGGASDIHIEPTPDKTRVRFRMDGELHTSLELPRKVHAAVVARIKIMSQLRLDEKRKPQDGRFSTVFDQGEEKRRIDFRVSTFPTQYGEKVVMRILDRGKTVANLETIGLSPEYLEAIKQILQAPYGIILVCGPTGSGKSTTLFSMLSELDRETQNVVSLEDPVEYEITGVAQSQVKPEIGYDFANGLRSILRQDPDVIMVGEIRDKETAALAIQAALTGHLVFSTIHTNTTAGVIPRLIDMGVDPYLIAPTLIAALGQRLVRKLCPGAGEEMPISDSIKGLLEQEFADLPEKTRGKLPAFKHFSRAHSTPDCPNGTRGRTGVFELLRMDKDLEHVVLTNPVEEEVYKVARSKGLITMREDAIIKALAGEIPFEEVNTLGGQLFPEEEEAPAEAPAPEPQLT